jgi:hypothetical protein
MALVVASPPAPFKRLEVACGEPQRTLLLRLYPGIDSLDEREATLRVAAGFPSGAALCYTDPSDGAVVTRAVVLSDSAAVTTVFVKPVDVVLAGSETAAHATQRYQKGRVQQRKNGTSTVPGARNATLLTLEQKRVAFSAADGILEKSKTISALNRTACHAASPECVLTAVTHPQRRAAASSPSPGARSVSPANTMPRWLRAARCVRRSWAPWRSLSCVLTCRRTSRQRAFMRLTTARGQRQRWQGVQPVQASRPREQYVCLAGSSTRAVGTLTHATCLHTCWQACWRTTTCRLPPRPCRLPSSRRRKARRRSACAPPACLLPARSAGTPACKRLLLPQRCRRRLANGDTTPALTDTSRSAATGA